LIIDPVLETTRRDLQQVQDLGVKLLYVLETHLHADHVTGASELRAVTGARVAVSQLSGICEAVRALDDGKRVTLGGSQILCIATPGHTPGCLSCYTDGIVLAGDCLLVGSTGRTDLPGGEAAVLFDSIQRRLWSLPAATRVYPSHEHGGYRSSTLSESRTSA
jgi:glyoxylase-like metal-dependent hydrolase (beta-lactamase superfamily II)